MKKLSVGMVPKARKQRIVKINKQGGLVPLGNLLRKIKP